MTNETRERHIQYVTNMMRNLSYIIEFEMHERSVVGIKITELTQEDMDEIIK